MTTIEELLTVRAVSPWLFFGEDTNGNGLLDAWENDGARQPPFDNEDGSLQLGLRDLLTVMGDGTLNVNTAPVQTLEALFRSLDSLSTDDAAGMARTIGTKRAGPDGVQGTEDDTPFGSTSEIAEVTGLGVYQQCRSAGSPLGVVSPAFTIDVHVAMEAERIDIHARGLVARQTNGLRLAYWRRE